MPPRQSTKFSKRARSTSVAHVSPAKKKSSSKASLSKKVGSKDHVSVVDVITGRIESSPLRRDFNLVRAILIEAEQPGIRSFSFDGYDHGMVQSHLLLLIEAGFLHGSIMREGNGVTHALVDRLTWNGHDLLALMRDPTRWQKAQTSVLDPHGRAHLDALVAWLKSS